MVSVISGVDFITTSNSIKLLEINTDINISDIDVSKFNFNLIIDYIIKKNLNKLHLIYKPHITSTFFVKTIKEKVEENNFVFIETKIDKDSIVYPILDDQTDTLILRLAYNARSIYDDLYCRDKGELIRLIFENNLNELFPKTYYNTFDNLDEYFCVVEKKILPIITNVKFPKIHKLNNRNELSNLKNSIEQDSYLQNYNVKTKNRCWFLISNEMNDLEYLGNNTLKEKQLELKYKKIFSQIIETIKRKHSS